MHQFQGSPKRETRNSFSQHFRAIEQCGCDTSGCLAQPRRKREHSSGERHRQSSLLEVGRWASCEPRGLCTRSHLPARDLSHSAELVLCVPPGMDDLTPSERAAVPHVKYKMFLFTVLCCLPLRCVERGNCCVIYWSLWWNRMKLSILLRGAQAHRDLSVKCGAAEAYVQEDKTHGPSQHQVRHQGCRFRET